MSVRMFMLGGVLTLLSCAAPVRALPPSLDPANPDGPEGFTPPASAPASTPSASATASPDTKAQDSPSPEPAHHHGHGSHDMQQGQQQPAPPEEKPTSDARRGTEAAPSYACPMHPEVVQSAPGRCPKCGMKLVKQQSSGTSAPPAPAPAQKDGGHMHHMESTPRSTP